MTAGSARVAASLALVWIVGCGGGTDAAVDAGPAGAGAPCASDTNCTSNICKTHCCEQACTMDPACGATTCDDNGACVYPSGACGTSTCNGANAEFTGDTCQFGSCVHATPRLCDGHFGCADSATCATTCSFATPCAPGYYCAAGACAQLGVPGTLCPFDAGCLSGYCGAGDNTTARCCVSSCTTGDDAGCGATGCDGRGVCIYPGIATPCQPQTCVGNRYTSGANCDGQGHCPGSSGTCAPYACGTNGACQTTCSGNASCFSGFCGANGKCCDGFAGNAIYVDGTSTATRACCGHSPATACQYLADAVTMAGEAQTSGLALIVLTKPADQGVVQLSYNIVVSAPGVTLPPLLISRFPSDTSTSVVVGGDNRKSVDLSGAGVTQVTVEDSMTLYLLSAHLSSLGSDPMVQVNPGGSLKLGTDGALNSGTVSFDTPPGVPPAYNAIACQGTAAKPASIDDSLSGASPSLHVSRTQVHLLVLDFCTVTLTHEPVFGTYLPCGYSTSSDDSALLITGAAKVQISNATFECLNHAAITMQGSGGLSAPAVSGSNNIIRNSRFGVDCQAGTFSMTNTAITMNGTGVLQEGTGMVDLSGGGNSVYCNQFPAATPFAGWDVVNDTPDAGLNARNVAWDSWDADAGHTERWSCDPNGSNCSCSGAASCSLYTTPEQGADTGTFNGILVDDTGGSQVPAGPNGPCP